MVTIPMGIAGTGLGLPATATWLLVSMIVWSLIWKAFALWKSARNGQKIWFVVLLITNTIGLLEILYLTIWQKPQKKRKVAKRRRK